MFLYTYIGVCMGIQFNTSFSLKNSNTINKQAQTTPENFPEKKSAVENNNNHTLRNISLGAVGAATVLISLGVLARNGKLGQRAQKLICGTKTEVKTPTPHSEPHTTQSPTLSKAPEAEPIKTPQIETPTTQSVPPPKAPATTETVKQPQSKMEPKPPASVETYSTKLAETVKEYTANDIDLCGQLGKSNFWTNANRKASADILNKVQNQELTTLYNEAEQTTNIIVPLGKDFYSLKINGIVSEDKAKAIVRTINANGLSDVNQFSKIVLNVLNGKMNTPYSIKNIGMHYDFHDKGAWEYRGGGGKWSTDGRMLLRNALKNKWEGYAISYSNPQNSRTTTQIAVALPSVGMERAQSNHYAIFLDGLIPPGTCKKLVDFLQTKVVKNPKDVQYEELAKIQQAAIDFLNKN